MSVDTTSSIFALFVNAAAGTGEVEKLLEVWQERVPSERRGPVFRVDNKQLYEERLEEAISHCQASGNTLVMAGGDGTLNSVLNRPAAKQITLGLIPTGTFNFFARSNHIPEGLADAIDHLLTATPTAVPLAYVNDKPFIVSVSFGLHPKVIAERENHTHYMGRSRLTAWFSGVWTILRARYLTRITICTGGQCKRITTPVLLINFSCAQLMELDRRFQCNPRKLAVLRLKPGPQWRVIGLILRGLVHHLLDESTLECEYVKNLTVKTRRKHVRVALDGELVEFDSPLEFHIQEQGFSCLLHRRP